MWPEDFIVSPDPAPPGAPTEPSPIAIGDVLIVAALPNPTGQDRGHELVTILNATADSVDLTGWSIADAAGGRHSLDGPIAGGAIRQETVATEPQLGNQGDTLLLIDANNTTIDQVSYVANQAQIRTHHLLRTLTTDPRESLRGDNRRPGSARSPRRGLVP